MANGFAKEEIVFFEQVLEGFDPNNITAKSVSKFSPPSTAFERSALTVHRPIPYQTIGTDGLTLVADDFADRTQLTVPSSLNDNTDIKNVPFKMNAIELNDPQQRDRIAAGAIQQLSAVADSIVAREVANKGTLFIEESTPLTKYAQLAKAEEAMSIRDVPIMAARTLIMNPSDYNGVAGDLAQRDAVPVGVSLSAYERSMIPRVATFDSFKANFMPSIKKTPITGKTMGAAAQKHVPASVDVNGNNLDNRSMTITTAGAGGVPVVGDTFTIAGVNAVSAIHKNDTGVLQTFRIVGASTATSWVISPAIVVSTVGSQPEIDYANCSAIPGATAVITFLNRGAITETARSNIFFMNEAVELVHGSLATMDLDGAGVSTMRMSTDSGIELLFAKGSDVSTLSTNYRLTMWMNANVLIPEMCGNIIGS
jgi:hypothetical protein